MTRYYISIGNWGMIEVTEFIHIDYMKNPFIILNNREPNYNLEEF